MEIILKQDLAGVGYKNEIVTVKPGFGRNYLIPQGLAILATKSNQKMVQENNKQAAHKASKIKQDAEALAASIGDFVVELKTKAGDTGKIFGSVTPNQVSDVLKAKGFEVDRRKIMFKVQPKEVGEYSATLDLHKEVKHEVKVLVVAE
jgi:large subunit ribosomal protein L9